MSAPSVLEAAVLIVLLGMVGITFSPAVGVALVGGGCAFLMLGKLRER